MDTYSGDINDPLSLNLYAYCHNEPLMYLDPTGHWAESDAGRSESQQGFLALITLLWNKSNNSDVKGSLSSLADKVRNTKNPYSVVPKEISSLLSGIDPRKYTEEMRDVVNKGGSQSYIRGLAKAIDMTSYASQDGTTQFHNIVDGVKINNRNGFNSVNAIETTIQNSDDNYNRNKENEDACNEALVAMMSGGIAGLTKTAVASVFAPTVKKVVTKIESKIFSKVEQKVESKVDDVINSFNKGTGTKAATEYASSAAQYQRLKQSLGTEEIQSVIKTTEHGAERLMSRGFLPSEISGLKLSPSKIMSQTDGASVYIKDIGSGKFNVIVESENGVVTALKNISQNSLNKLSKNYGWK